MTDFHDLIDIEGLSADEEARLRRVHELLVSVGPPPEVTGSLAGPPTLPATGRVIPLRRPARARLAAAAAVAAVVAGAAFAGGYLAGHHGGSRSRTFAAERIVRMHAGSGAVGLIRLGHVDPAGNWTMLVTFRGLPVQTDRAAYYTLWLTRGGKRIAECGKFRMSGTATTVWFNVPYRLRRSDGWMVTASRRGEAEPGHVVMVT